MNINDIAEKAGLCSLSQKSWYIATPEKFERLIKTIIAEHEREKWQNLVSDLKRRELNDAISKQFIESGR